MADKSISVSLDFIANTSQAEASLKNLQASLANISNLSNLAPGQAISKELLEASDAAIILRTSLQSAFNTNTGKLDLSKFSTSLAGANTDVRKLGQSLMAIGPEGQAAFRDLTNAVLGSSTPLQQTNALVGKLWDSLKRTAGWQLSSSMIHGFMGAISSAYGYAQDLNKSLNNIRIVTGASTDEMAKFAEQANKSAKALSTTTTDYTDAALIYYQQGIRDQNEIAERVAVTTKLANVSRQSAEEVSSQMTAIWNNFDDGSHSLEYYADVITALGAATASSSQEISRGLQQFAATAQTVGLSYEYATSALATIVATTRQSADTVGTGLRTLFARLEGLKLGETLEDGVDLNKYSKALEAVGVQVLDTSGNLKNMDTILDDLATKWGNLGREQKMALAQTVGGVRQYNNLIALMDNWDSMQQNLSTATGATGALQEQQDRYAEGWEAAQKRAQTAAEGLYQSLLDDKFFIGLTNAFAGLLEHLEKFIDGIGGLGTLLPGLIVLMNKMFGPQIQENIAKASYNIAGMFTKVKQAREARDTEMKNQVIAAYKDINMSNIQDKSSVEGQVLARSYERIAELQGELVANGSTMTQQQKDIKNLEISRLESLMKINAEKGKSIDLTRREAVELAQQGMQGFSKNTKRIAGFKDNTKTWQTDVDKTMTMQQKIASVSPTIAASLKTAMTEAQAVFGDSIVNMSMKVTEFHDLLRNALNISPQTQEMSEKFVSVADSIGYIEQKLNNFQTKAKNSNIPINIKTDKQAENVIKNIEKELDQLKGKLKDGGDAGKLAAGLTASLDKIKNKGEITEEEIQDLIKQIQTLRTETNKELELKIDTTDLDETKRKVAEEQNQNREQAEERGYQAGTERANVEDQPEVPEIPAPDISGYEQFAAILQNVANYAMQTQMAISGLNSILDVWTSDEDIPLGEKIQTTLGGIAAIAPIVITLIQGLGKSAATAGAEAAVGGAAAATGGTAAAGGITAIGTAINTVLPWVAAIGLAFLALITIYNKFHKTQEEIEAAKIEELERATENAAAVTEHATQKVTDLKNAYNDFLSSADRMKGLSENTQEYNDALTDTKEKLEELIKLYGLTPEDWSYDPVSKTYSLTESGEEKRKEKDANAQSEVNTAKAMEDTINFSSNMRKLGAYNNFEGILGSFGEALSPEARTQVYDAYTQISNLMKVMHDYDSSEYIKDDGTSGTSYRIGLIAKALDSVYDEELSLMENFKNILNIDDLDKTTRTSVEALLKYQADNGLTDKQMEEQFLSNFAQSDWRSTTAYHGLLGASNDTKDRSMTYAVAKNLDAVNSDQVQQMTSDYVTSILLNNPVLSGLKTQLDNQGYGNLTDLIASIGPYAQAAYDARVYDYNKDHVISNEHRLQAAQLAGYDYKMVNGNYVVTDANEKAVSDDDMGYILAANDLATNPKYLIDHIEEQLTTALKEAMTQRTDETLKNFGNDVSETDKQTMKTYAENVDWTDETDIDLFRKNMQVLTNTTPEVIEEFINALRIGAKKISESTLNDDIDQKQQAYDKAAQNLSLVQNYEEAKRTGEGVEEARTNLQTFVDENGGTKDLQEATQTYINAKNELDTALNARINEDASKYNISADYLSNLTKSFQESNAELAEQEGMLENTAEAAEDAAVRYARVNQAVEDLQKNSKDYLGIIQSLNKDSSRQNKLAVQQDKNFKALKKSIADLLNVTEDFVDVDFLETLNPKDIEKAATGDIKAIKKIRDAFIDYQAQLAGLADDPNLQAFKEKLDNLAEGAVIELDTDPFIQGLISAKLAAGAGATEIENMLSGMQISTDGIEEFTRVVDQEMYDAVVKAQGNSEELAKLLSLKVSDDEQIITDVDPQQFTSAIPEEVPFTVHYSVPQFTQTDTGGYEPGPPATGTLNFPGFRTKTEEISTKDKKQHTIHGIKVKNGHKEYGGIGAPTKSSSGNGGGGGGGGGSKKSKEAPKADRGTRYHNVTRRQSNVSRQQTENNRRKDRAFGKAQVELSREDLELQKKKIELQEEYTKEISKNLKDDREEMKKQFEALQLPINFKFDEDGEISNYQEIIDALFEKEKALVEQYNAGGLDDEAFDEAKKKLDEAKEALGNYEETLEKQKDELQTLSEYMEELSDKALELTQIKFELNMSIIEDQLEWLDYSLSEIEDDAYSAAKAIALMGEQTSQYLKQGDVARAAISEILGRHGVNSIEELNGLSDSQIEALGFNKDEIDALKDYRSQLYESNQALLEMRRTITDKILDTFDTFNEKVSESYEEFDNYNDILEKYTDIVDLLGTKTDAATKRLVKTLRDTQLQNLRNQSVSAKEIYEGALANYNLAEKQYNDAVARYGANSIEAQQMEEIMKQAADARDDAYSNWLDAYQASLEKAREIYEAEMEELQKDFERSLTGIYGTFDLFDAAYERAKELKDNYLPEYEKIYELNKLNRDIQKEIDNSSSLHDKKALRQLQDEINRKQEAGVQLSKYEVEEMRKKFELEQARMNLEDARNSKSEVRLTRDQNGNWGYVYTASEDKVADAEQKYEDALYQYQKLSDDYITDLDEKIKNLGQEVQEQIASVWEAYNNGEIDEAQRDAQIEKIKEWYDGQKAYIISQFETVTGNLQGSLGLMKELFGQEGNLFDSFGESLIAQLTGEGSLEDFFKQVDKGLSDYITGVNSASETLKQTNENLAKQNELNIQQIATETEKLGQLSDTTKTKTIDMVNTLSDNFASVMGSLQTWDQQYGKLIADAIGKNDTFITSLNDLLDKLRAVASYEMKDLYDQIDLISGKAARGETITKDDWDKLDALRKKYGENYSKEVKNSAVSMDTGGYTGEWGSEGKLAILHEKEYVLNQDLTLRFFDAIQAMSSSKIDDQLNQALSTLEYSTQMMLKQLDFMANRMNSTNLDSTMFNNLLDIGNDQILDQQVHIEANFPNAQNHIEIEEAFENLVNKASQYANRKNMSSMTFQDAYISKF